MPENASYVTVVPALTPGRFIIAVMEYNETQDEYSMGRTYPHVGDEDGAASKAELIAEKLNLEIR